MMKPPCYIRLDEARQRDNEMRNVVLTDAEARNKATRHSFSRALLRCGKRPMRSPSALRKDSRPRTHRRFLVCHFFFSQMRAFAIFSTGLSQHAGFIGDTVTDHGNS